MENLLAFGSTSEVEVLMTEAPMDGDSWVSTNPFTVSLVTVSLAYSTRTTASCYNLLSYNLFSYSLFSYNSLSSYSFSSYIFSSYSFSSYSLSYNLFSYNCFSCNCFSYLITASRVCLQVSVASYGTNDEVLKYLSRVHVRSLNLNLILWRMNDIDMFKQTTKLLASLGEFFEPIWNYSMVHLDLLEASQFSEAVNAKTSFLQRYLSPYYCSNVVTSPRYIPLLLSLICYSVFSLLLYTYPTDDLHYLVTRCNHSHCHFSSNLFSPLIHLPHWQLVFSCHQVQSLALSLLF